MNIFISGGFGLLGARTAIYFSNLGFNVTIGTSSNYKYSNFKLSEKIKVKLIDWDNFKSIENAIKGQQIIFHFAGMSAQDSLIDPVEANNFNGYKTKLLLEISSIQEVKEFIFLSTAHVYSDNLEGFFNEESSTVNKHPYATSNLLGERFVEEFHINNKINAKILRLSNTFGAPEVKNDLCWSLFVNNICKQIIDDKKVRIFSNPKIYRNFIAISDFNYFLHQIVEKEIVMDDNIILNVGSINSIQLDKMAELIISYYYQFSEKKIEIVYEAKKNSISKDSNYEFSINKALELGIKPSNSTKSELTNLFKYCIKNSRY